MHSMYSKRFAIRTHKHVRERKHEHKRLQSEKGLKYRQTFY